MSTYIKRLLLLLVVLGYFSISAFPQDGTPQQSSKTITLYLMGANKGKRIPPKTYINCEVVNEMIFFDPNFDYDCMNVEVSGTEIGGVIERRFTIFEPYVIIPLLTGECTIRCSTEAGAVYEGSIVL